VTSGPRGERPASPPAGSVEPAFAAPASSVDPAHAPDLKWDLLILCIAGYLLTSVGRVHQLFPTLEFFRPTILTGALAIGIYLLDRRVERRPHHLFLPTTKWLLAFLVWMILAVPGALRAGNSFDLVFDNFVKTVLMYLVVVGAVRGVCDVERLGAVYLAAATVYASVVISRFDLGAGDAWRLDNLYYYDSNDFATFAVTAMPFGLYFVLAGRRFLVRSLAAVGLATLLLAFVRTGSRGGFVALVAVVGFIVLRSTGIPLRWRLSATALVAFVVLGVASDQYWTRMGTILSDASYDRTEESGRLQIWSRGLGYIRQFPVLGVGPNNFPVAEGTLSPFAARQQLGIGVRWNAPHNTFLQVAAELGIPGLIFFIGIIASAFGALRRSGRRGDAVAGARESHPQLTQALTGSLIGFVVGSVFLSLAYSEMLYTLVALAVGMQKVSAGPAPPVVTR